MPFEVEPKRFILVANNPDTDINAECVPRDIENDRSEVVVRFNNNVLKNRTFGGKTDVYMMRLTGNSSHELVHDEIWIGRARALEPPARVLGVVSHYMLGFESATGAASNTTLDWDGLLVDPEEPGVYAYSTGFAALRFLHENWPNVPIMLLGFDGHADQKQHKGAGMPHDFTGETAAIEGMIAAGGIERCGV